MSNYSTDFKKNFKELKTEVFKGNAKLENGLRKLLGKPLPKEELFKKYKQLEEYYNSIGNNPIDEPDLDFEIEELEKSYFNDFYVQILQDKKGFDFKGVEYEDVKLFASKVSVKVKSYEEDGILKKIDKFNDIDFLKMQQQAIKIAKIVKDFDEKIQPIKDDTNKKLDLMLDGFDPDIDDASEFENERLKLMREQEKDINAVIERQSKDIEKAICEILSVKKSDFKEWEFTLLRLNALAVIGYNGHTSFLKGEL